MDDILGRVMAKTGILAGFLIVCGMGLAGCSNSTSQPGFRETTSSTITQAVLIPTVEVTPTVIMEPTPTEMVKTEAQLLAEKYGLDSSREYSIVDGYLVDGYNQAKMMKKDGTTNEWVDTSLEEKYGHLAPMEPLVSYIHSTLMGESYYFADADPSKFHENQSYILYPVWTGNTSEIEIDYKGIEVTEILLEVVLRDDIGELHRKLYAYFALGLGNNAIVSYVDPSYVTNGTGVSGHFIGDPYEILAKMKPGLQLYSNFINLWSEDTFIPEGECKIIDEIKVRCSEQKLINIEIFKMQKEELRKFAIELFEGRAIRTSENLILPQALGIGGVNFIIDSNKWIPEN